MPGLNHVSKGGYREFGLFNETDPGGRLNIKMPSYQYRDPRVKDKTISRPSYP